MQRNREHRVTIVDEQPPRNDPLGGFTVERVVRDDGRYLLYYGWPDSTVADAAGEPAGAGRSAAAEPWTPEAGPLRPDGDRDV